MDVNTLSCRLLVSGPDADCSQASTELSKTGRPELGEARPKPLERAPAIVLFISTRMPLPYSPLREVRIYRVLQMTHNGMEALSNSYGWDECTP